MPNVKIRKNSWSGIHIEILARLGNACKSLSFIAFFLIGIIVISGIGVWLPAALDKTETVALFESQNVFTYSVAILGTLFIDGFLGRKDKQSFAALGLIVGFVAFLLCCIGYYAKQNGVSYWVNAGAFLALILFLMANVNDERFDDESIDSKTDATGFDEADADLIKDKTDE